MPAPCAAGSRPPRDDAGTSGTNRTAAAGRRRTVAARRPAMLVTRPLPTAAARRVRLVGRASRPRDAERQPTLGRRLWRLGHGRTGRRARRRHRPDRCRRPLGPRRGRGARRTARARDARRDPRDVPAPRRAAPRSRPDGPGAGSAPRGRARCRPHPAAPGRRHLPAAVDAAAGLSLPDHPRSACSRPSRVDRRARRLRAAPARAVAARALARRLVRGRARHRLARPALARRPARPDGVDPARGRCRAPHLGRARRA